ncbi:MAG: AAA family ATPase [Ignavibacteriales bacterium]|nr:AAA family ATPase [Ignavibacteriales bacterium]
MIDNWNDVYGQQKVKECLDRVLQSSQIPHAFLFQGPDGIGKHFTAIRFIQLLNSNQTFEKNSLVSSKIKNFSEPFVKLIIPLPRGKSESPTDSPLDKLNKEVLEILKSEQQIKINNPYYKINLPNANNIKISSIREIKNFLSYTFDEAQYRVILIEDAHLMSDESQNALLKSLEEPPEKVIFILITNQPETLFETIKSRCWQINFDPLEPNDISEILINNFNIQKNRADSVASFASGSVTEAIELLNHNFEHLINLTINILRFSLTHKIHSAIKELNQLTSENSSDSIKLVIKMIIIWLNDIQKERSGISDFYFNNNIENLKKFNHSFPSVQINTSIVILNELLKILEGNVNLNIASLNLIFELTTLR